MNDNRQKRIDRAIRDLGVIVGRWDSEPHAAMAYSCNQERRLIRECLRLIKELSATQPREFVDVDAVLADLEREDPKGMVEARAWAEEEAEKLLASCWCHTCRAQLPLNLLDIRMVVCPTCGNKRCPRAENHLYNCTGSNEPGQRGVPLT